MPRAPARIDEFVQDEPTSSFISSPVQSDESWLIDGVSLSSLSSGSDGRGALFELLTSRGGLASPIVHVYQVMALPGSVRAWVFHKWQKDRLAFTNGAFRVVLYDIRPESRSFGKLNVLEVGEQRQVLLTIPEYVVHGVQNYGHTRATFVNMPTKVYDPGNPDKFRLPQDHSGIPYTFS